MGQCCVSFQSQAPAEEDDEGEEEETEELGQTETYAEYVPSKCEWLAVARVREGLLTPVFLQAACAVCPGTSRARGSLENVPRVSCPCWCCTGLTDGFAFACFRGRRDLLLATRNLSGSKECRAGVKLGLGSAVPEQRLLSTGDLQSLRGAPREGRT